VGGRAGGEEVLCCVQVVGVDLPRSHGGQWHNQNVELVEVGGDVEIDCGGMCVCVVKEDEVLNWILVMMTSI